MLKYKVILAGTKDVGKSSLIARFCDNVFYEKTMETIGVAFKKKKINIEGKVDIELNIWDFGGEEKYRTLFPSYCNGASAALILYDITNKDSLNDVINWVKIIKSNALENASLILIGTKIDLKDKREITRADANKTSQKFNLQGDIIETSAKTGENVEKAFLNVTNLIINNSLQTCKKCNQLFPKKLKICNHCGQPIEVKSTVQ